MLTKYSTQTKQNIYNQSNTHIHIPTMSGQICSRYRHRSTRIVGDHFNKIVSRIRRVGDQCRQCTYKVKYYLNAKWSYRLVQLRSLSLETSNHCKNNKNLLIGTYPRSISTTDWRTFLNGTHAEWSGNA